MATDQLLELTESDLDSILLGQQVHFNHYGRSPLPFACLRGHGIEIDAVHLAGSLKGQFFHLLDASGGYASACLGAGHPVVRDALDRAVREVGYVTDELASLERARLLTWLFGQDGLWREQFTPGEYWVAGRNSGSEGMELALRLVLESRFDPRRLQHRAGKERRDTILAFEGAWHGWTGALVPLLNRGHYKVGLPAYPSSDAYGIRIEYIPFGDFGMLRDYVAANADRLLAVFVEPVQGDAGILIPPAGYLRTLSELCTSHGALLVADEVLTFAKTGHMFAMRDEGAPVPADITVIGKSLGMGALSTSMVVARRELRARAAGTVATSDLRPLTCAVIQDGLRYIVANELVEHSREIGKYVSQSLKDELADRYPEIYREVRGVGLIHGIELSEKAATRLNALRAEIIKAGVYVEFMAGAGRRSGGLRYVYPTMRVALPLTITIDQADEIVSRLVTGTRLFHESS